jgi:hypothetical protein
MLWTTITECGFRRANAHASTHVCGIFNMLGRACKSGMPSDLAVASEGITWSVAMSACVSSKLKAAMAASISFNVEHICRQCISRHTRRKQSQPAP